MNVPPVPVTPVLKVALVPVFEITIVPPWSKRTIEPAARPELSGSLTKLVADEFQRKHVSKWLQNFV